MVLWLHYPDCMTDFSPNPETQYGEGCVAALYFLLVNLGIMIITDMRLLNSRLKRLIIWGNTSLVYQRENSIIGEGL